MPKLITGAAVVAAALLLLAAGTARADRVVNANEPVIVSNDINNRTTEVHSADGTVADAEAKGSDNNRSGLGDGTNPGEAAEHTKSGNEGTDNPNRKGGGKD